MGEIQLYQGKPALLLAPMEGVTDAPMRALMAERGGFTYCVAEFLRISQQVPPRRIFVRHMPELQTAGRAAAVLPVQLQLLGGDPERLGDAAETALQAQASAIDLNFGCPARTVNRHDGGASLLKFPERIRTIVRTVRQRLPAHIPVSVKLRLGWDDPRAIHVNAAMAEEGGAAWITIHGRTRMQGYKPPAYWHPIGEIQRRLSIPVVANGDIWTLDDLRRCQDETGCSHFMLGRGAMADPSLPLQAAAELGLRPPAGAGTVGDIDWPVLLRRFVEVSATFSDWPGNLPGRIKQWLKTSHQRFANPWYERLKRCATTAEILAVLPGRD